MPGKNYVGKGGHLATMAEFLLRGYNVAMPEVDVGDDIFVVSDRDGQLWRIQVKTAMGKRRRYGYSGQFAVSLKQLEAEKRPDLFYVFALRTEDAWEFLILPREALHAEHQDHSVGTIAGSLLILTFRFQPAAVLGSGRNFQSYRNNWGEWPVIDA
jgi:hypothetical protein